MFYNLFSSSLDSRVHAGRTTVANAMTHSTAQGTIASIFNIRNPHFMQKADNKCSICTANERLVQLAWVQFYFSIFQHQLISNSDKFVRLISEQWKAER